MISIEGLSRAEVLAGLYNAARPQGLGFLHYDKKPMTTEDAQKLLDGGATYFDYLQGRVMKMNFDSDNQIEERLYDRDNGAGAAQQVIDALRAGNAGGVTSEIHKGGVLAAADHVKQNIDRYGAGVEPFVDTAVKSTTDDDDADSLATGVLVGEGIASLLNSNDDSVPDSTGFEGFSGGDSGGGGASDDFSEPAADTSDTGTCDATTDNS